MEVRAAAMKKVAEVEIIQRIGTNSTCLYSITLRVAEKGEKNLAKNEEGANVDTAAVNKYNTLKN